MYIFTGKSLSEGLIFASTKPQYDDRLFIELKVQYVHEYSIVYRNFFWHSEQFLYTTCSPPCSAKRRASDKDLPG